MIGTKVVIWQKMIFSVDMITEKFNSQYTRDSFLIAAKEYFINEGYDHVFVFDIDGYIVLSPVGLN